MEGNSVTFFESQKSTDCVKLLKSVKSDNLNKLLFAHLSINSIRNKFEFFCRARDVLMISETKIYDSFPTGNFVIDGCSTPCRVDRNYNVGGTILYT